MELLPDKDVLIFLHNTLVELYSNTEDPITLGYSEGMVDVCVERPLTDIYNFIPFPHILHKAAVLMETMIGYHPFVDGNKRVALLATYYYPYWNGYDLHIPSDAAEFTIDVAKGNRNLNSILSWLTRNTTRSWESVLRNKILTIYVLLCHGNPKLEESIGLFIAPMVLVAYPFMYFRTVMARKTKRRKRQKRI